MGSGHPAHIGPYRIVRRLGAGGMAEAFEAVRTGDGPGAPRVCLKRVLPAYAADPSFAALFAREARVAASLAHPNVVQVVDVGADDGDGPYLVLELVDGLDLRALCATTAGRMLPVDVVCHLLVELLHALHHAHTRPSPVVHRDVSAGNVLLSRAGDVKLADFGLAKTGDGPAVTRTAAVRGTLSYLAPELLRGEPATPSSDRFALGVLAYEALVGRRPFDGAHDVETMTRLLAGRLEPVRQARPETPAALAEVVEALCAPSPAARLASAREALLRLSDLPPAARAAHGRATLAALVDGRLGGVTTRPHVVALRRAEHAVGGDEASASVTLPARRRAAPPPVELALAELAQPAQAAPLDSIASSAPWVPSALTPSATRRPQPPQVAQLARAVVGLCVVGAASAVGAAWARPWVASQAGSAPTLPTAARVEHASSSDAPVVGDGASVRHEAAPSRPTEGASTTTDAAPVAAPPQPMRARAPTQVRTPPTPPMPPPMPEPAAAQATRVQPTPNAAPATAIAAAAADPTADDAAASGTLRVVVVPWGNVWIDGRLVGRAPQVAHLPAGVHRVAAGQESPGAAREVRLGPGSTRVVELELGE